MDPSHRSSAVESCADDQLPSYETALRTPQPDDEAKANVSQGVSSYCISLYPFYGEYRSELSFKAGQLIHLLRHVNKDWMEGELDGAVGIFPKSFVDIIVDVHEENPTEDGSFDDQVTEVYPADCFARVLFDFVAVEPNDLELTEGSTITLLRKIGNDWVEAMDDAGNIGICPLNYVEIIVEESNEQAIPAMPVPVTPTVDESTGPCVYPSISQDLTSPSEEAVIATNRSSDVQDTSDLLFQPTFVSSPRPPDESSCELSFSDLTISPGNLNGQPTRQAPPRPKRKTSQEEKSGLHDDPSIRTEILSAWPQDRLNDSNRKSKENEQRKCILTELIQSERDYLQHLKVCHNLLREPANSHESFKKILGNLPEVIDVSTALNSALERAINNDDGKGVGRCFIQFAPQMKESYKQISHNSEEAQVLWKKLSSSSNQEVKSLVNSINNGIRNETNSYDLPSLIFKPVQRVLKYPLLLFELSKCTHDAEEQTDLNAAFLEITKMAREINESKRGKELVTKYRRAPKSSFAVSLSRFNLHTLRKKSSRFGFKLTSKIGMHSNLKDSEFDSLSVDFKSLEKTLKIFIKDLSVLVESQESVLKYSHYFVHSLGEFYGSRVDMGAIDHLAKCHKRLIEETWSECKKNLKHNVFEVLNMLLSKFSSPSHLIDKRNDKLADFDSLNRKVDSVDLSLAANAKVKDDHQRAKNDYEALNNQLVSELPKLIKLSVEIITNCISAYMSIQKSFIGKTSHQMLNLLDTCFNKYSNSGSFNSQDIYDTFHIKFTLLLNDITKQFTLIPASLFTELNPHHAPGKLMHSERDRDSDSVDSRTRSTLDALFTSRVGTINLPKANQQWMPQTTNQRENLLNKYRPGDLYIVTQDHKGVENMQLTVKANDVLAVVKKQNPMNNPSHWTVDDGRLMGFVPANILKPMPLEQYAPPVPCRNSSITKADPVAPTSRQNSSQIDDLLFFDHSDNQLAACAAPSSTRRSSPLPANLMEFDPLVEAQATPKTKEIEPAASQPIDSSDSGPLYVSMYAFKSTSQGTLSITQGQIVTVIAFQDLMGNKEWFLVRDYNGNKGYVPHNYVKPLDDSNRG